MFSFVVVGLILFVATALGQTTFSLVNDSVVRIGQDTVVFYFHGYSKHPVKVWSDCRGISKPSFSHIGDTLVTSGKFSVNVKISNLGSDSLYRVTATGLDTVTGVRKSDVDSISFRTALPIKDPELKTVSTDSISQTKFRVSFNYDFGGSPAFVFAQYGKTSSYGYKTDTIFNLTGLGTKAFWIKNAESSMKYYVRVCAHNKEGFEDCKPLQVTTLAPQKAMFKSVVNQYVDVDTVTLKVTVNLQGATNPRAVAVFTLGTLKKVSDTVSIPVTGVVPIGVHNLSGNTQYSYKIFILSGQGTDSSAVQTVKTAKMPTAPSIVALAPVIIDSSFTLNARIYCNSGQTSVTFYWREKGSMVFESSGSLPVGNSGGFDKSHTVNPVESETVYEWKVVAKNAGGEVETTLAEFKTAKKQTTDVLSLENSKASVFLYPNPAKGMVSVTLAEGVERGEISFYDIGGKMLKAATIGHAEQISTQDLPVGLYIYRVQTSTGVCEGKLIVE